MVNYQNTLLLLMEVNDYNFIPNYESNFTGSLDQLESSKELEKFCYNVLQDLQSLIDINK